jgi:hypothetical protein
MKRIDFTRLGGADVSQNVYEHLQSSFSEPLAALARLAGNKTILYGVEVSAGVVSDGWISYNGELIRFIGGTYAAKVVIATTPSARVYADGVSKDMLYETTATCGAVGAFNFSELEPLQPIADMWLPGDIKSVHCDNAYLALNFDSTGLGINRRKGWAICNGQNGTEDMGGRVLIGYDAVTVDPANNVWDVIYNTMLSDGGEKRHTLAGNEQGSITMSQKRDDIGGGAASVTAAIKINGFEVPTNGASNQAGYGSDVTVPAAAAANGHENRQPFKVSLFIQKLG